MTDKEYIVIHKPSFVVSLLEDIFSFGGFVLVLWFNHRYLNGNGWLDALFVILWISTVAGMQSRRYHQFTNIADAIKYLEGKK